MAGDTSKAALWENADVFIAEVGSAAPTDVTTPWDVAWSAAGLLNGEDGFVMSRDEDTNDFFAWGGVLVKSTKSNQRRTIQFTCLEDNDTVFGLINPGSPTPTEATGVRTAIVKVPTSKEFAIGFELKDGDKIKRRTVKRATLDSVGDATESEQGLASVQVTVVLLPEADGELYREVSGAAA